MRDITLIVIHCSATRADRPYDVEQLSRDHSARGFDGIGYHLYVRRNGEVVQCRHLERIGAHAKGYNARSIGVCYEGGLDSAGRPADTRTPAQKKALLQLLQQLRSLFPEAGIVGHRDLPGVNKACPCFDAMREYAELQPNAAQSASDAATNRP